MKAVPKLRFPDFTDYWNLKILKKVTDYVDYRGKGPVKSLGGIFLITAKNIKKGYIDYNISKEYIPVETYEEVMKKGKPEIGDIIFTTEAPLGNVAQIDRQNIALAQRVIKFRSKNGLINSFLLQYILSSVFQKSILQKSIGSTVKGISGKDLHNLRISIPTLPEQQKIASFLSAIDDRIQQLTRKKEGLEQYKKGVMQQIFSQQIRFKRDDGGEYPGWERKTFESIYKFHSTNSLSRDNLNYNEGSVYNIHYGDIHKHFKTIFRLQDEIVPFINDNSQIKNIKKDDFCKNGDLVLADASEDYNDVGKAIEVVNTNNQQIVAGLHTILARPDLSIIEIGFGGHLIKSPKIRNQIMKIAQGTKVLSISSNRLAKIEIHLPVIKEQQKIASFLSSIDQKIDQVDQQVEKNTAFKKGLLQQMFV
jgi:type I restriction enzyme S subunit